MIDREALKAQQLALQILGYYKGNLDGIWSRKTIDAKIAFERSGKFNPGIPNSGLPFNLKVRLPKSLKIEKNGYLAVKDEFKPVKVEAIPEKIEKIEIKPEKVLPKAEHKEQRKPTEVTVNLSDLNV